MIQLYIIKEIIL